MDSWKENARNRVKDSFTNGNFRALWKTLSVPANKVSREAFRDLSPDSPAVNAKSGEWLVHLDNLSRGALRGQLAREEEDRQRTNAIAEIEWKRREDEALASGYPLNYNGKYFPNAKAWLSHLRDTGWIIAQKGIGTLTFDHPNGHFIAPKRNKHLNAAHRLLEN
jgi:hypothetical protein